MKSIRIATLAGAIALAISGASMAQSVAPAGNVGGARANAPGVSAQGQAQGATGTTSSTTSTTSTTGNTTSGSNSNAGTSGNVDPAVTRPGSFEPGGAFGTSGTTSGTAGATTSGAGVTAQQVDVNGNPVTGNSTGVQVVPGTGSVITTDGTTQAGSQQTIVIQQPGTAAAAPRTPLLDEATRKIQARDAQRKATGETPRVEAIAPRTDRDLTRQMPDDPVIRY